MSRGLEVLELMLEATKLGRLQWSRTDPDSYTATINGEPAELRFYRFERTDEDEAPTKHAVEVTASGLSWDFAMGTRGFEIAWEIVVCSDPPSLAWRETFMSRAQVLISNLQDLTAQGSA